VGISGAPRGVGETLEDSGAPGSRRRVRPATGMQAHGYCWSDIPCRPTIVRDTSCPSAGIDQGPGGGPHPHDDAHRGAPGRTAGRARGRRGARGRLAIAGVSLLQHQAAGRGRDGTAGMEQAEMPDFHNAIGEDVLEEPAEQLPDVEVRGAWAGTAHFAGSEGDRAVRERDDTLGGDGTLEDIRGEGGEGGVAVVMRLTVDVPGDHPDLGVDRLSEPRLAHLCFEERTGDGRERFDRDKAVRSGRAPGWAILGEATARDHRVEVGVGLEWPAPGMQDAGEPRQGGPEEARVVGQPLAGRCRRLQQGVGREALMGADAGSERLRDRQGAEDVRPRELRVQVALEPLVGLMLLALGTVAVATGMIDAVWLATTLALREAMAIRPALALLDGADDLAVGEGSRRGALQVCWSKGGTDLAQGGHGRSPCMRVLRRS
jgi:hypothetical protein